MKFYPVGAIIKYDNIRLLVVKSNEPLCTGCYFSDGIYPRYNNGKKISCIVHKLLCTKYIRYDKCHVIFVKLSE